MTEKENTPQENKLHLSVNVKMPIRQINAVAEHLRETAKESGVELDVGSSYIAAAVLLAGGRQEDVLDHLAAMQR